MRQVLIGVDGGGTTTKVLALDACTMAFISEAEAGSIHVYNNGMESAVRNFKQAVDGLKLADDDRIIAVGIGDPAIDESTEELGREFIQQIRKYQLLPADAVCVSKSDVFMALYAFSEGAPAALLVAGTGSMGVALLQPYCFGKKNEILTVGGWGFPNNDPGSGYSIALNGITAAMDAFDGIAPHTMLCEEVLRAFHVSDSRELIDVFNIREIPRSEIASFALRVDACATAGDETAITVLRNAGEVLGRYGLSMLRKIDSPRKQLAVYGSVLLKNNHVRKAFESTVHCGMEKAEIAVPSNPPEYGAALYAANMLKFEKEGEI